MKILVIGEGGREHAIVWSLSKSPKVTKIYCAPGNPGIGEIAECVEIKANDIKALVEFSREISVDLTIVGPEEPLVMGIVDAFRKEGLRIIGPTKEGAMLEGSKAFSKRFMEKYKIPTGKYTEVSSYEGGLKSLLNYEYPVVIKADGLAAGKGVFICGDKQEAEEALKKILKDKVFGSSGDRVIVEEYLEGIETSILCFVDGNRILPMVSSQDHKRIYDGDRGPNTGGMGTYSPNDIYNEEMALDVKEEILEPTLYGIQQEGMDYRGIVFIGLMITPQGPKVLEYNVRFGDPETQVVLTRLETDLVEILQATLEKRLKKIDITWKEQAAVCVILASGGYPIEYQRGKEIKGLESIDTDVMVFHSGTKVIDEKIVTNGGRVLGITALGGNIEKARSKAYRNAEKIYFEGITYRRDIAQN
ncbi:phosphoribosylamine--glycine ligase [Alkaliphilus serpentinus]|uniref:Phosphoribosylamine--glycine ligase n=1 Tax=Alkaliphilus serpentinus TaxID=1482731 RepID=A0A833MB26_9FIRM|nr:phosphoribosylamine--glycine ligase [Alkaliphilus serpentinus]KAB3532114.1 phosphoribosylamine--glycine ligase [Alkaliphilus serpentinus]